jgi:hypothetical protein
VITAGGQAAEAQPVDSVPAALRSPAPLGTGVVAPADQPYMTPKMLA